MTPKKKTALILFIVYCVIALTYFLRFQGLSHTLFLIPPFIAFISAGLAASTYKLKNEHGKVMAILSVGMLCWFIGESIFLYFQFVTKTDPFPSIADVFYVAGYPIIFVGLMKEIKFHKVAWHDFNKLFLTLSIFIMLVLAVIVSYFGIYLAYSAGDPLLNNAMSIAYGIGDLILIIPGLFILKIALDYKGGKLYNSWILVLAALMFMMTGDILFAIFSDPYTALEWPFTLIDLSWVLSYLLFAYSFYYTSRTIKDISAKLLKK